METLFHDGRLLGLLLPLGSSIQFLAYRGVVSIPNEARHLNILIRENFSLNFYNCKGIFDFSWKYDVISDTYF